MFFRLEVIGIGILNDHLSASPRIHLHLQPFVLIIGGKGVSSDDEPFERDEVSGADQVVLIFDVIVREVELDQGWEVAGCQFLCVNTADLVPSNRDALYTRKGGQARPEIRCLVIRTEIVSFQIDAFEK